MQDKCAPKEDSSLPSQDIKRIADLETAAQDCKEELAILCCKFDLEVRHAQHLKRRHESACAEIGRLRAALESVNSRVSAM